MTQRQLDDAYAACNILIDYLMEQPRTSETCRRLDDINSLREDIVENQPTEQLTARQR